MRAFILSIVAGASTIMPVSVAALAAPGAVAVQTDASGDRPIDGDAVTRLVGSIATQVVSAPAIGNRETIEANVMYAVDQSRATCPVTLAALRIAMTAPRLARASQLALNDVLTRLSQCDPSSIAALNGGLAQAQLAQGPAVGVGGGNSNYDGR